MVEPFNFTTPQMRDLLDFILNNEDHDFYFTENNARVYVTDKASMKRFFKQCSCSYLKIEKGNVLGFISAWKSLNAGRSRYYVKLNAINAKVAEDLIIALLWKINKELFVKIRHDSKFVAPLKHKGFRFIGSKGIQILLNKKYIPKEVKLYQKEDDMVS